MIKFNVYQGFIFVFLISFYFNFSGSLDWVVIEYDDVVVVQEKRGNILIFLVLLMCDDVEVEVIDLGVINKSVIF